MSRFVTGLFLAAACTVASHAQLAAYGGFSGSVLDMANSSSVVTQGPAKDARLYGGTVGLYYDGSRHPLVNFGVDVRGTLFPEQNNADVTAVLAGPRVKLHLPVIPLRPYGEALVGGARAKTGQGVASQDRTAFAGGFAVGADLRILPFIDWRVLEYSYTHLNAALNHQQTLTTGIVIRFPFF